MDLDFKVDNQIIKPVNSEGLVNYTENYLGLKFDFRTNDWQDCDKYILILHDGTATRLALVNDSVVIGEQFLKTDRLVFTVYGVKIADEKVVYRITTNKVRLDLLESGFTFDYDENLDPVRDADIIEQLWNSINQKADTDDLSAVAFSGSYFDLVDGLKGDEVTVTINESGVVAVIDNVFADKVHTHIESDITDLKDYSLVGHTHTKSEITDFAHTHDDRYYTESETDTLLNGKSDTGHNHDNRYYTEDEVNTIIEGLNNRLSIDADKTIIQTGDKLDIVAYRVRNGVPQANKDIYFYIKEDN